MVLGSGIPDPGVKKAPDPGTRIPDPDPQHWVGMICTVPVPYLSHCIGYYLHTYTQTQDIIGGTVLGTSLFQCCGSGIRCLFDPGIRDG
jgi:hypothetical protein